MKSKLQLLVLMVLAPIGSGLAPLTHAQQPTSRVIPFNNLATTLAPCVTPPCTQAVRVQLWDVATGGTTPLFSENQTVDVDDAGNISFVYGSMTPGPPAGLDPANFPSGSSRFLDVVDQATGLSLLAARMPLNATPFALSPGPAGPAGPPGVVQTVTAGDLSITVGGTAADRLVSIRPNGVTNAQVANGALSPAKITGTAATLGPNNFVGNQDVSGSLFVGNPNGLAVDGVGLSGVRGTAGAGGFGIVGSAPANGIAGQFNGSVNVTGPLSAGGNLRVEGGVSASSAGLFDVDAPFTPGGRLRVLTNGNVGIGTNMPAAKLHVAAGNINLDDSTPTAGNILKGGVPFIHNFGFQNTFIGGNAGNFTMTGGTNTASGVGALSGNTTGNSNTAIGFNALKANTTGFDNTAVGTEALLSNTTLFALRGVSNTAVGGGALRANTTGFENTASGVGALSGNTTGSDNTAIGVRANVSAGNLTNATAIGAGAVVDASNKIRLGSAGVTVVETSGKVIAGAGFNGRCTVVNVPFGGGDVTVNCNQDFAETFVSAEATEPGEVLILASQSTTAPTARRSSRPYDDLLLGVVSTSPGLVFDGGQTHMAGDNSKLITPNKTVVGLAGRVPVKVCMENGPIRVGDPLTSSSTPGVAMKATRAGKILGYALESGNKNGKVLLFVQPGYYAAPNLKRLHAENATLRTKIQRLSLDNVELRATVEQSHRQIQELLRQVKGISRRLDTASTVAQSQP